MDRNLITTYGFISVTAIIISVILMLATPFGDYIGDAYVSYVSGAKDTVDYHIDEGFHEQMEYYDKEMNQSYFATYVEAGLYEPAPFTFDKTSSSYNPLAEYTAPHLKLNIEWNKLIEKNVIVVENAVLRNGIDSKNITKETMNDFIKGDLVISNGVLVIEKDCFADCKEMSSIYIKSVNMIEDGAFKNCEKLKTLYINSDELQIVGKKVFEGTDINHIYYNGTKEQFCKIKWAEFTGREVTIHCTDQNFRATI